MAFRRLIGMNSWDNHRYQTVSVYRHVVPQQPLLAPLPHRPIRMPSGSRAGSPPAAMEDQYLSLVRGEGVKPPQSGERRYERISDGVAAERRKARSVKLQALDTVSEIRVPKSTSWSRQQ